MSKFGNLRPGYYEKQACLVLGWICSQAFAVLIMTPLLFTVSLNIYVMNLHYFNKLFRAVARCFVILGMNKDISNLILSQAYAV